MELVEHRPVITEQRPTLPHQAGRALARFYECTAVVATARLRVMPAVRRSPKKQADRVLMARPLVQPEIDVEKLARAFISLALGRQRQRP